MKKKIEQRLANIIGVATTPPMTALVAAVAIHLRKPRAFGDGVFWFLLTILLLAVIPCLSYVVALLVPSIRRMGRQGQRRLAFVVSVISYIAGTIVCLVGKAPRIVLGFFLSYLAAGSVLSLINGALDFKASGHACGCSGSLTLVTTVLGTTMAWAWIVLPAVFWARIRAKRHSMAELISATLVGATVTAVVMTSIT